MDPTAPQLQRDPRASLTFSAAERGASAAPGCFETDPQDPTCAKVTMPGTMRVLEAGSAAEAKARAALFARHPEMRAWPKGHAWLVVTLDPTHIFLLDHYGGAASVDVGAYYNATPALPPPDRLLRGAVAAPRDGGGRPFPTERARFARWLVHGAQWGVVGTRSVHLGDGFPFGNAMSLSDGAVDASTGQLFFFLTTMDWTGTDLQADPAASVAVSEATLPRAGGGTRCRLLPAEDPNCARVTLSGTLANLTAPADLASAKQALFSRHPAMKDWPAGHAFTFYEL